MQLKLQVIMPTASSSRLSTQSAAVHLQEGSCAVCFYKQWRSSILFHA